MRFPHPEPRRGFLRSRRSVRILIAVVSVVVVAALVLTAVTWPSKPRLSPRRVGDPELLATLGEPKGLNQISVAVVDLDDPRPTRFADFGATPTTPYEAGSLTKALTGLAIADSVQRGELRLSDRVSEHLPSAGTAAGDVSLQQLVTHQAGYPRLGRETLRRGQLAALTGANPYTASVEELLREAREAELDSRGTYRYSNLGAAVAGQAVAAAAGLSYRDLMRSRVFEPLRMTRTEVADRVTVADGYAETGNESAPWVMDGYAPAGGVVTTSEDLATFATAVLEGRAPGRAAMKPLAGTDQEGTSIGMFWHLTDRPQGQSRIVWHNGRTGGYSSFIGFDLDAGRAVVVLANVAAGVDELGVRLLTDAG